MTISSFDAEFLQTAPGKDRKGAIILTWGMEFGSAGTSQHAEHG